METAVYAFFWVAIAHAIQYLWITSYFTRYAGGGTNVSAFLGKALLAGALIWVVPVFLFSPTLLGNRSYDAGLSILVAAAVNVHHFVLDGAIWKLREGRIASILLREVPVDSAGANTWLPPIMKPALLVVGVVCVAAHYVGTVSSSSVRQALVLGDLSAAESSLSTLQVLQRDDAQLRRVYAQVAMQQGEYAMAAESARIAVQLDPSDFNRAFLASVERRTRGDENASARLGAVAAPFSPKLSP